MAKTYNFKVLGCRVNHAERREMEAILHDRGLLPNANGDADIEVVHTCSVTGQAAAKSRNAIRRASRLGHTVFVTGCFTGTDPKVAAQLGDVVIEQAGDEPAVVPMIESRRWAKAMLGWPLMRSGSITRSGQ